jgi:hypothetical protein
MPPGAAAAKRLLRSSLGALADDAAPIDKRVQAAEALRELAAGGRARDVVEAGAIPRLLALVGAAAEELQVAAASALHAMAADRAAAVAIIGAGVGRAVGGVLQRGLPSWRLWDALAELLARLGGSEGARPDQHGITPLTRDVLGCGGSVVERLLQLVEAAGEASGSTTAAASSSRQQVSLGSTTALRLLSMAAHKDPAAVASLRPASAFVQLVASAAMSRSRSAGAGAAIGAVVPAARAAG